MSLRGYIEYGLARLLANSKFHDDKLFKSNCAFTSLPKPNMTLISADCGRSNSVLDPIYTQVGENRFPSFTWSIPEGVSEDKIREYIFISEDPDAPLPVPILHGLFWGIPPSVNSIKHADTEPVSAPPKGKNWYYLKNDWKYVNNRHGKHYSGPRPFLGHGPHRYFFTIVALSEPLDPQALDKKGKVTREMIAQEIDGKVIGWGEWVGVFERKWE